MKAENTSESNHEEPIHNNNNENNNENKQDEEVLSTGNVQRLDVGDEAPISETRRSVILTASTFAMICASTSYAFNLFSKQLQVQYNYNSRDMSNINTVGMCFCYFLLPYGLVYDYIGPLPIYALACVLGPLGLLLMGLTFQGVIEGSVVRFCVYNALLSLGSQLFDLATVVTVLTIFPTERGWVTAVLKTLMGLGSAIIGLIKIGFFPTSAPNYFYFLVALMLTVGLIVPWIIKVPSYHITGYRASRLTEEKRAKKMRRMAVYLTQEPPLWKFYLPIAVIIILIVYLPTTTAVLAFCKTPAKTPLAFAIVAVIVTLCFFFILMPCDKLDRMTTKKNIMTDKLNANKNNNQKNKTNRKEEEGSALEVQYDVAEEEEEEEETKSEVKTDIDYISPAYQTTFLQSCCTPTLWCIFWTMFCGVGSEFVIIFNANAIYQALDEAPVDATVGALLTVLNGSGSAIGRLAMSAFEMWTQKRKAENRIPITYAFFVPTTCIILSMILFLVLPGRSRLVAFAMAALGNGFCASVTVLVIRTLYAKDPAKHYNFGYNALWVAGVLLNRFLYGEWSAVQAEKQHSKVCYGRVCVLMPMCVMIGLNCTAMLTNVYVHFTYIKFSKKVLVERRRIKEEGVVSAEPFEEVVKAPPAAGEAMMESSHDAEDALQEELAVAGEEDEVRHGQN